MSQAVVFRMNFALLIHVVVTVNTGTDTRKQSPLRLSLCIPCFNVREYIHKGFCTEISKLFYFENEPQWGGEKYTSSKY